jgi:hypothetical protein
MYNELHKRIIWKLQNRKRDGWERKFTAIFKTVLNGQFRMLALKITPDNMRSDMVLQHITSAPIESMFVTLYQSVGVSFAKDSYSQYKTNHADVLLKQSDEELEDEWNKYMTSYAKTTAGQRITSITAGSKDMALKIIRQYLEQSANEGWGSEETARAIRNGLNADGIEMNQWRALRIARTEVVTASNIGSLEGAKATGATEKYWIATHDNRVRQDHLDVEGQNPKLMDEGFFVGGAMMECPGDPDGGAEQTINCRCTIAFG